MPPTLIVTADDFGYSDSVNEAVVAAHRGGILRYASLMVLRPAAASAARLAAENPGLGVGLHLELCADAPEKAGLRYFFDPKARAGVDGEIRRQFDALMALGVRPTHADGHFNIQAHPVIFPALCRVAREYKVPRVRLPAGELSPNLDYPGERGGVLPRAVLAGTFAAMRAWVGGAADGLDLPRTWGLLRSGRMTEDYLLWLIGRLPPGATEIYFHPCADPASEAPADRPTPTHQTVTELRALVSPRVRAELDARAVALASARG